MNERSYLILLALFKNETLFIIATE